tara:strand:- start:103496 stop:104350 length:855 start_codon:yes stop_codon:yes gene_type:complete
LNGWGAIIKKMFRAIILVSILVSPQIFAGDGKLLATPGVSQVEGSGGGGLVPWAQLAGYASQDEIAVNAFCTQAELSDFRLRSCGAQLNLYDRVEFSVARQNFRINALDTSIDQKIVGVKTRLYGDLVFSKWPMLSLGMQYKHLDDTVIAQALGAKDTAGIDWYLAASKLHLGAVAGYNLFWNITARHTDANELGILGFGGPYQGTQLQWEASTAIFFSRELAVGIEYRQKPDNLALKEDNWSDVFVAWLPNKSVSLTAAWLDLGTIAGAKNQKGPYFSMTGYF